MATHLRSVPMLLLLLGLAATSVRAGVAGPGKARGEAAGEAGKTMKIMTYNIRHGADMNYRWNLWKTADVVRKAAPDVACFQEVEVGSSRSFGADEPKMLAHFLEPEIRFSRFSKSIDFGGGQYGNAMVSSTDPLSTKIVPLPGREPRSFLLCEFEDCYVGTTHLDLDAGEALKSVPVLVEATKGLAKPVFLTGDWNSRPDSAVLKAIGAHFVILSDPSVKTCPSDVPTECIDYIAVDKGHAGKVRLLSTETIDDRVTSDHRPVVVACELLP